jgi:CheY-like chemotaxis protein
MTHKLLLADDSVTIQRVIELTFADEDVEVTTVGDGQLAIDRLDVDPPDIILADVDMPKRDGYEVAAYVKSRPKLAHIPVVLLTGAFEPVDQARAAAAGSSDVLAKPFEPQMVINRVKELLGKKRQSEAAGAASGQQAAAPPAPQSPQPVPQPVPPSASQPAPRPVPESVEAVPPPAAPAAPKAAADAGQVVSLDDYFDQLDAAFSNLQSGASSASDRSIDLDWPAAAPSDKGALPAPAQAAAAEKSARPVAEPVPPPTGWADVTVTKPAASAAHAPHPTIVPPPPAVRPVAPIASHATTAAPPAGPRDFITRHTPAPLTPVGGHSVVSPVSRHVAPAAPVAAPPVPSAAHVAAAAPVGHAAPVAHGAPVAPVAPPVEAVASVASTGAASPVAPTGSTAPAAPVALTAPTAPTAPSPLTAPAAPSPGTPRSTNPFANLSAAKAEAAARPPAPVITDEIVEEIVSRVLQRMSDKVVRETVTDIVSQTAERLVQEEIERIKNAGS